MASVGRSIGIGDARLHHRHDAASRGTVRAVQEMARHRLSRMHYIGVSRQVIQERPQRRAQTSPTIYDETYFFAHQQGSARAGGWDGA